MSWSFAYAFRAGADHERCDDACACEDLGDFLIAAVSDGAGSASKAYEGASIACQAFAKLGPALYSGSLEPSCLIEEIRGRIPAEELGAHNCTLVGVIAGKKDALFLQVGDGAAVYQKTEGAFQVAQWPEDSEFLNQTWFVTSPEAADHLMVHRVGEPIERVALFTDGLQHLVIDMAAQTVHDPFFESVFKNLSDKAGQDMRTSWWLERTLGSDPVTKRTDDDTSIIIARRARAEL